jgi:hypothetical protein
MRHTIQKNHPSIIGLSKSADKSSPLLIYSLRFEYEQFGQQKTRYH